MEQYRLRQSIWLAAIFSGFCSISQAGAASLVSGGRMTEQHDGSQLVFDLDAAVQFRRFLLDNPPRLVVDIRDANLVSPLNSLNLNSQDVIRVRAAPRNDNRDLRLVMELRDRIGTKTTLLRGGRTHHLVVDFFRPKLEQITSREAPAGTALTPGELVSLQGSANPATATRNLGAELRPEDLLSPASAEQAAPAAGNVNSIGELQSIAALRARHDRPAVGPKDLAQTAAPRGKEKLAESSSENTQQEPRQAAVVRPRTPFVVALDPGHGGRDPGALGPNGTREKHVVMQIAQRLKKLIDKQPGMHACLTRAEDKYLRLSRRIQLARTKCKANLFVSVHADAYLHGNSRGASVFVLSTKSASSAMARFLAKQENQAGGAGDLFAVSDKNLKKVLIDMVQDAVMVESRDLAQQVLKRLGKVGKLHSDKVEFANFAVLKAPDIPSILVETAFISNPDEERKLTNAGYQKKLAKAILGGIFQYLKTRPQLWAPESTVAAR